MLNRYSSPLMDVAKQPFIWQEHTRKIILTALLSMVPMFEGRYAVTVMLGLGMPPVFAYLLAVIASYLPVPKPALPPRAVRALTAALSGALQAEYDPETTVGDLKLLVKQGVSGEDLARVLKSRMAVAVTPAVRSALSRLETETIPWGGLRKGRLN